ncbi:helix-turn-helix domain-containing protein [Paenibacillus sp. FSL R7-0179]|uniref:helix-turn-helix domain-containing protein n=1 Tax=Paenibacillus sp. FSL R7-0179 TaxID=2921672 RepID=UPI0030FAA80C
MQDSISIEKYLTNYIDDFKIIKKIKSYFERHDNIGEEIFPYLGEKEHSWYFPNRILSKESFLRRIPFYFHQRQDDLDHLGELEDYVRGVFQLKNGAQIPENIERLFLTLEHMYYHHHLELNQIFNYPIKQKGLVGETGFLFQWTHYLDLIEELDISDKLPTQFITAYNHTLEKSGLQPIIYPLFLYYENGFISREKQEFKVYGTFPCDEFGQPILRWIGIKIKNQIRVWAELNRTYTGEIHIEAGPRTGIWGLNCWNNSEDGTDYWYPLHIGPQLMEFDNEELKSIRIREGYTQKEVATAIGASIRSYQKWEAGETTPDSHNLLRLLNFLDIQDPYGLARYLDIEDVKILS